nr:winged helix-turn-helix domain-containing protein [Sphingomonas arenae]
MKLRDLAKRSDFRVGALQISPSRRCVEGPAGSTHLEPLTMNVFLTLLDADGAVVTRDELFEHCWGGAIVGDDSLNRAIAKVRRIAADTAPGLFEIETIPRTGYRLTGEIVRQWEQPSTDEPLSSEGTGRVTRRRAVAGLAGGALATAIGGGVGLWWVDTGRSDRRFQMLLDKGRRGLSAGSDYDSDESRAALAEAVRLRPERAEGWGLLALALRNHVMETSGTVPPTAMQQAHEASNRALVLDPGEPNALLAAVLLQGSALDWYTRDQRLREIIARDPRSVLAIAELTMLTQAAGLNRESWRWNERALALEPQSFEFLAKRALKHWIAGRVQAADKVVDEARILWPTNAFLWLVRVLILATTGRAQAALALLASEPRWVREGVIGSFWEPSLHALAQPSPARVDAARDACLAAAKAGANGAVQGVMLLSALKQVDAAFATADGFLLWRGGVVRQGPSTAQQLAYDALMRVNTQWLFTPPCAIMRQDPRFLPLCEGIGLTEYWRRRGVQPDYLLDRS